QTQRAEELSLALARRVRAALVQSVFHRLHGAPEVLFGTRPARRVDTWLAAERVDGQSGIIRERRQTRGRCRSACLDAGVRLARRAAFCRLPQAELGRGYGIDSERHEKLAHLLELAWIVRGDHQLPGNLSMSRAFGTHARTREMCDHITASFCRSTSFITPFFASASRLRNCSSLKGIFSAVACTSTMCPPPVITKLASVSASESSA